jgi:hypothetical protein
MRPFRTGRDVNCRFAVKQFNSQIVRMGEKGGVRSGVRAGRYCPAWGNGIMKWTRENSKAANPCCQPSYGRGDFEGLLSKKAHIAMGF